LLKIRLSRVGKKKRPAYRIVVADSRAARDGAQVDIIGHYDPLTDPATIVINEEKALHWLQRGAQPSEAAAKLLAKAGVGPEGEKQTSEAQPEGGGEET
jgi:small subunit ribosomal protein S16